MHPAILRPHVITNKLEPTTSPDAKTETRPNVEKDPTHKKLHNLKIDIAASAQNPLLLPTPRLPRVVRAHPIAHEDLCW